MTLLTNLRAVLAICTLIGTALPSFAAENNYPNKPLKMIVPYEPGGGVDIMGRLLARHLSTTWVNPFSSTTSLVEEAWWVHKRW